MKKFETLIDVLEFHASSSPNSTAYSYHYFTNDRIDRITFGELRDRAKRLALFFISQNISSPNVLLVFSPGLTFIEVFLGCLYAGLTPIPMPAPMGKKQSGRFASVIANSQATCILTDTLLAKKMEDLLNSESPSAYQIINCQQHFDLASEPIQLPQINPEDTAFIQYTSGSVGDPKGVVVSHRNILHNEHVIKISFEHNKETVVVGWLPMFHDMGLIGNVLQPLYLGVHSVLFSPLSFIQNPFRWLELITLYKATTSGGPNFGYDLCTQKITEEEKKSLNLSSWTLAFCGAEPIRNKTVEDFIKSFSNCGFSSEAFYPCYGLAESTLFVTGVKKLSQLQSIKIDSGQYALGNIIITESDEKKITLISCGKTHFDQRLLIVNPETRMVCSENTVGEIWIDSKSKSMGYWKNSELNERVFNAKITDYPDAFLRTGDLGFLRDENLYITGRLKDTIIIRGSNFYPQDIEHSLESSLLLPLGSSAVFSEEIRNEERLIVMVELRENLLTEVILKNFKRDVVEVVTKNFDIRPYDVFIVEKNTIPKGSSGKIQRYLCKKLYTEKNPVKLNQ